MTCKACGAALPEGAHFCSACGTAVPVLPELIPDPEGLKAAPLSDMPEPTAPMYTPAEPVEPEPVYAQPVYADPVQSVAQSEVDSIFTWGVVGLVCAFLFSLLGIIFSAIAISKSKRMREAYGFLPQRAGTGRSLGIAGLIISIVLTALALLFMIVIIAAIAYGVSSGSFYYY